MKNPRGAMYGKLNLSTRIVTDMKRPVDNNKLPKRPVGLLTSRNSKTKGAPGLLYHVHNFFESLRFEFGEMGERFAVEGDAFLLSGTDKFAV